VSNSLSTEPKPQAKYKANACQRISKYSLPAPTWNTTTPRRRLAGRHEPSARAGVGAVDGFLVCSSGRFSSWPAACCVERRRWVRRGTRSACGLSGGLDGLEDDAGYDLRFGDEGQVPGFDVGDVGAGALGHERQLCGRDDLVCGPD